MLRHLSSVLLFLALTAAATGYLYRSFKDEERQHLVSHLEVLATGYRASVNMFSLVTENYVQEIVSRPDVFDLVRAAIASEGLDRDRVRGRLYRMLHGSYDRLRGRNIRHFHFHLPGGTSFLRFHQPELHGDSVYETRSTVRLTNTLLTPTRGFEVCRFTSGFRYVYPLLHDGEHLGSVDLSVPLKAIRDELARLDTKYEYSFVLDQKIVKGVLVDQLPLYSESPLHPDFLVEDSGVVLPDSLPPPSANAAAINKILRNDRKFQARLRGGDSFAIPVSKDGEPYAVSFLRMRDVDQREIGYLISYCPDPLLKLFKNNFLIRLGGAWSLIGALGLFFWYREGSRQDLQRERRHLAAVTETMIDGLLVTDESGLITLVNPAACSMLGHSREEMIGRLAHAMIHPDDHDAAPYSGGCVHHRQVMRGEVFTGEKLFRARDGALLEVEVASSPLRDETGNILGVVTAFRDISTRKQQENELKRLASTDALTGLANRRCFFDRLGQDLARLKRFEHQTALLMVDLDHFKQVNDSFGHSIGDEVLQQFAAMARQTLREVDLIGRIGGEEFVVLLPGADAGGARIYGERLRQQVSRDGFPTGAGKVMVTVSIGGTVLSARDANADAVLSRADRALYQAKENGRNRVEIELPGGPSR